MRNPKDDGAGDRVPAAGDGPIRCSCGDVLADRIDGMSVVIDGVELQFRRWSDETTCRRCGATHTMGALRAADRPVDAGLRRRESDRSR